ncbi:non-homologous end-joining DNA ligase [Glycomyces sp. L485]|uniref:non-homologous end-joining DNA ligase n=1 Tax=Glycomyces sp. L485 TaxID=2909235 RepID=UPI001F4B35B2|nr:non-homologous end-joining DNA ligase [Glycomyces sp. L485]MCH7231370.1 non-homologous end-joining DNA ligase [Glycomyces sp. L485]
MTGFQQPMLATLTERRFSNADWLFERKLDGMRALAVRDRGTPQLWSRNERRLDERFPELVDALGELGGPRFVADGEIVAFDGKLMSFARLQARIHLTGAARIAATGVDVYYYLFDLLSYDGRDLTRLPLRDRKRFLRDAFDFRDPLRYTAYRNTEGEAYFEDACSRGWEGLIAKRANSPYRSGRSKAWLKFKCVRDQEFVVGGFTEPQGSRTGFGALLVGYHEGRGELRYAGKVGTGYDERTLRELRERMDRLARDESPFADPVRERGAHWIHPEVVVQVGFGEWTADGMLRHPRYRGERPDKPAEDVVRETI